MLINFTLAPLARIVPWGEPGNYRLHWFGLTYGEYWIEAGEATLLEYSDHARAAGAERYCTYQVVRLHEDLMEMLPYILEPVPDPLVPYISGEGPGILRSAHAAWCERVDDGPEADGLFDFADAAVGWIENRRLDSSYLLPSANVAIWSDEEHTHIAWDNRGRQFGGEPAWSASLGSYLVSRVEFIEEIKSFHDRLMEQMAARVAQVASGCLPSEIQVDLPGLITEHEQRTRSFDAALKVVPATDWRQAERAVGEILTSRDRV